MSTRVINPENTFCSRCGARFPEGLTGHLTCPTCTGITFVNPKPVAVLLVPFDGGILCGRRGIPPHVGGLALFSGFMEKGENWRRSGARELFEETGIEVAPEHIRAFHAPDDEQLFSTPNDNLLVFMTTPRLLHDPMPGFVPNSETLSLEVVRSPVELVFPAHTRALRAWFAQQGCPLS